MKFFCLIVNRQKEGTTEAAEHAAKILKEHGFDSEIVDNSSDKDRLVYAKSDLCIVFGGDGTMINAAASVCEFNIPIFGINCGNLGFLTGTEIAGMEKALDAIMSGDFCIEKRMMLSVETDGAKDTKALNDVVVARNGYCRVVEIKVFVNGEEALSYYGDGVVIATPTGSTGYSLSAGGSVVKPDSEMILITPVCPHSINIRGLIVSAKDTVKVTASNVGAVSNPEASISVSADGLGISNIATGASITIKASQHYTKIIKLKDYSFFDIIKRKLSV